MRHDRMRIGQGFDMHAFDAGRPLILGGVEVPSRLGGLHGHSDADVLTHAITSALLGSLALGDLGRHFPEDDPQWEGADSLQMLRHAVQLVGDRGFRVVNCDSTIVAQEPRLAAYVVAMQQQLATCLQVPAECVSVKATTAERLGSLGRSEGIAAQAVVLVTSDVE
jgi:2-C-methyl-D-erythritol 2,4-cyclodiphosphate synthase